MYKILTSPKAACDLKKAENVTSSPYYGVITPELGTAAPCPKGFPDGKIQMVLSEGLAL